MNNELLKKLKDSGFPFTEHDGDLINEIQGGLPYSVTLSELIEACGDDFDELYRLGKGSWLVNTDNDGFNGYDGATPEEAVANLWLSLNQK